jgi:hypothetical protein
MNLASRYHALCIWHRYLACVGQDFLPGSVGLHGTRGTRLVERVHNEFQLRLTDTFRRGDEEEEMVV